MVLAPPQLTGCSETLLHLDKAGEYRQEAPEAFAGVWEGQAEEGQGAFPAQRS